MKQEIYVIAKSLEKKIASHLYHLSHKLEAKKILKNLELAKGKTEPKLIKLSDEYARDVLGRHCYAPWLYVYSAVAENFKEGWIPDNYYGKVVVPAIKGDYGRKISALRPLTKKIFSNSAFPDIAYYVNGLFFSIDYEVIPENEIKEFLFKDFKSIIFKVDSLSQGKGVFLFQKSSFYPHKLQLLGNGVFQHYIEQHPFFEELMPTSVATLRVTTILDGSGKTSVRACYLRIGRSVDTHVKSASHIRIPVNLKSGELDTQGYLTTWLTIDRHPDTNIIFSKKRIPDFNNCISTALELHSLMPYAQCIGWDMIIDKNHNVKVMEWNGGHNDIKFSEATQGPCFSDLGWEKLWRQVKKK